MMWQALFVFCTLFFIGAALVTTVPLIYLGERHGSPRDKAELKAWLIGLLGGEECTPNDLLPNTNEPKKGGSIDN